MADPVSAIGLGASAVGGVSKIFGAKNNADAQKLAIQGKMLETMGAAFGHQVGAQQYQYQANISKYQAAVSLLNKQISKQNAAYARDVGEVSAQQVGMKSRAEQGEMIAFQGSSGLSVAGGSATRVREGMIELGYYDQMQTRASAAKTAYGYEIEATMHQAQADVYSYTAEMQEDQRDNELKAADMTMQAIPLQQQAMSLADTSGTLNIMGSLAGTAGSVADKWMAGKGLAMITG
jgi:hypothetical protein